MGLTRPDAGAARSRTVAAPALLGAYLTAVSLLGIAAMVTAMTVTPWAVTLSALATAEVAFLVLAAWIGEVKPLPVFHGNEHETISASTPFILALIPIGGIALAVLTQTLASLSDDILRRRDPRKSVFNAAQYALSVLAAGWVFTALSGQRFGQPVPIDQGNLAALLAGGVAMVLVNRVLVGVAVSMAAAQPLLKVLGHDGLFFTATQVVLLCIGAVAANVAPSGWPFLVLLCAPAIAVYLTTAAAIRHAHHASHDRLTGLGNRDRLQTQLATALAGAQGQTSGPGLVLVDLDHFKDTNDTLGHPVGDELLRTVTQRLTAALGTDALLNRLGGDEFAVVVHGGLAESEALARTLLASLKAPMQVGDLQLLVGASAGVAVGPDHGTDAATLMKNADVALYQAKLERGRTCTYSPSLDVNTVERLGLLGDLRTALNTGQLSVAFQPQVDLVARRVVAVEALIRWQHPTRGAVPPDGFIPLAENSGLIGELTAFVLDTALSALARWRADGHDVRMAVNLSARQLSDLALPDQVAHALARHEIPATRLVLEVTETGILSDPARADVVISALRQTGVEIAVDDYGTGQASLSYLKRLDIDELKIDRSFVSDMGRDDHDLVIVRSTVALARDLGLRVIAEGIEDEDTTLILRGLGCHIGQGYHLGRPTTAEQIGARLEQDARALPDPARKG